MKVNNYVGASYDPTTCKSKQIDANVELVFKGNIEVTTEVTQNNWGYVHEDELNEVANHFNKHLNKALKEYFNKKDFGDIEVNADIEEINY